MNHLVRTGAWLGALAATLAGLLAAGERLAPPPLRDPASTWAWLEQSDPATAAFSLVRLAAIAVVAYLLVVTIVLIAAQTTQLRVLIAASTRLTLPAARRLVRHAVGAGVALGMAASTAPMVAGAQTPTTTGTTGPGATVTTLVAPDPPPVLQRLDDDPVLVHLGPAPDSAPSGAAVGDGAATSPPDRSDTPLPSTDPRRPPPAPMTTASPTETPGSASGPPPLPVGPTPAPAPTTDDEPNAPTDPTPGSRPAPSGGASAPPVQADGAESRHDADGADSTDGLPTVHAIATGDHLWGVSERTLAHAWGVAPDPDDVADYLDHLIEANRSILAIPDDPDLVFPGQVFVLPPVPAR